MDARVRRTHSVATGERYQAGIYPDETDDKRAARLFTYKHAAAGCRLGHMVTLAGTEPHEVTLARDYLGWSADRAWFVDWAKSTATRPRVLSTLDAISDAYPGVHAVCANVCDVIERLPIIGFANLDHMGFDHTAMRSVCLTLERLAPRGTMSLTWYRGREWVAPHRSAWKVFQAARDVRNLELKRWVGVCRLVEGWAREAGVRLELLGGMDYYHRFSPMSVIVWRRRSP